MKETFTKKFEDEIWSYFSFLHWLAMLMKSSKNTKVYFCCKFLLFIISHLYPYARRLLERQSHNNHLKLKAYNFLRIIFLEEVSQYPVNDKLLSKILSEAARCAVDLNHNHYEKFAQFLGWYPWRSPISQC